MSRAPAIGAFVLTAAAVSYYALRGGSFDLVVRQEEALAIWWALGVGHALAVLRLPRLSRDLALPLVALALLALWSAVSLLWTGSYENAAAELARLVHYAGLVLLVWSLAGPTTWRAAAGGLCAGAALVCALAVASRLMPDAFPENAVAEVFRTKRLSFPFDYWNAVGAWSAMSIAMLLSWSAHASRTAVRAASLGLVPVCALAGYLTYSRATVLATALAVVAVVTLSRNRWTAALHAGAAGLATALPVAAVRGEEAIARGAGGAGAGTVALALAGAALAAALAAVLVRRAQADGLRLAPRGARLATAGAALVAVLVALPLAGGRTADAWEDFREREPPRLAADPAERLTSLRGARYYIWDSAIDAFEEHPLGGLGAGSFEFWWNERGGAEFLRDAHSLYLEHLAELGLPGLALVLLAIGGLALAALRARRRAASPDEAAAAVGLAAVMLVFIFQAGVDWLWESTAVAALALACAALASCLGRPRPQPRPAGRAALAGLAAMACLVQLPGLLSTSLVRESAQAAREGSPATASVKAGRAVRLQPWAARPYVQRALVSESTGDLAAAARDLWRAVDREPPNWRHRLLLARVEAKRRRFGRALAAYRTARRLRPRASFFPERGGSPAPLSMRRPVPLPD